MEGYVGLTTIVYTVRIDELWVRCVRARPCQTTELPCSWNEVCKAHSDHIATLLNEKELHNTYWSNWKSTSLNICLKIVWKTFAKKRSPEVSLGGIKTLPWSLCYWYRFAKPTEKQLNASKGGTSWRMAQDYITMNYHKHPQAPCASIAIGSCSKCCKPQRSKAAYSEDDNVNSVAPETSSEVKGPKADVGGTKANQEELQCHHVESHWKPLKTTEKHALPRTC